MAHDEKDSDGDGCYQKCLNVWIVVDITEALVGVVVAAVVVAVELVGVRLAVV